jgi:Arc/MetJ-type ribon-helix-helix transcriptional regulator
MEFRINIEDELIPKIKEAMKSGGYNNASDFINFAIRNELEGLKRIAPSIDNFLQNNATENDKILSVETILNQASANKKANILQNSTTLSNDQKTKTHPLAHLLRKEKVSSISKKLNEKPLKVFNQNTIIWGQINRFLPMKIGLNIIAQEVAASGDEFNLIKLIDLINHVKPSVGHIGEFLKLNDIENKRKGSKKISVGFASGSGLKLDKGIERFTSHFIVRFRKTDKQIEGALIKLGFIELYNMGSSGIKAGITDSGIKFLNMKNPVIDKWLDSVAFTSPQFDGILSDKEITYLIDTIQKRIPADYNAMMLIMNLIKEGENTQSKIQNKLSGNKEFGSSPTMIDTNKNGIIARLSSLGLIRRNKELLNVEYALTKEGSELLAIRSN